MEVADVRGESRENSFHELWWDWALVEWISLRESESHSVMSNSCDSMDCSPLGSSVHGILQARILEWVAVPFSRGSSWPREPGSPALQADSWPSELSGGDAEFSRKRRDHGDGQERWKGWFGEKEWTGKEQAEAAFTDGSRKKGNSHLMLFCETGGMVICCAKGKQWGIRGLKIKNFFFFYIFERILRGSQEVEWSCSVGGHLCWSHEDTVRTRCLAMCLSPTVPDFRYSSLLQVLPGSSRQRQETKQVKIAVGDWSNGSGTLNW